MPRKPQVIVIGADHGAFDAKAHVKQKLMQKGYPEASVYLI